MCIDIEKFLESYCCWIHATSNNHSNASIYLHLPMINLEPAQQKRRPQYSAEHFTRSFN